MGLADKNRFTYDRPLTDVVPCLDFLHRSYRPFVCPHCQGKTPKEILNFVIVLPVGSTSPVVLQVTDFVANRIVQHLFGKRLTVGQMFTVTNDGVHPMDRRLEHAPEFTDGICEMATRAATANFTQVQYDTGYFLLKGQQLAIPHLVAIHRARPSTQDVKGFEGGYTQEVIDSMVLKDK